MLRLVRRVRLFFEEQPSKASYDEAERSLHDALAVLSQTVREPRTTLGGGCAEMLMAKAVEGAALKVDGKKQIAVGAFAVALRQLPTIFSADNAGYDSSDLVAKLPNGYL